MKKLLLLFAFLLTLGIGLQGAIYYVDNTGGSDEGAGTIGDPWETLAYAVAQLSAGDTLYIRAGTYMEKTGDAIMYLDMSGTSGSRITIENYTGETVNFLSDTILNDGAVYGVYMSGSYLTVKGIHSDQGTWGGSALRYHYRISGNNNILDDCLMKYTSNEEEALRGVQLSGNYNQILNCEIGEITRADGGDAGWGEGLWISGSYNLVQGCTLYNASHNVVFISGGSYNIIRDNDMSNDCWRIGGVNGLGMTPRYNVWEDNVMHDNLGTADWGPSVSGIQNAGVHTIMRRNTYYTLVGEAWTASGYVDGGDNYAEDTYAYHNTGNDLYNDNLDYSCALTVGPDDDTKISADGLRYVNNILYDYNRTQGEIWYYGDGSADMVAARTNTWYDTNPLFTNAATHDFTLQAGSPCVNTGSFLTTITSANGSGTSFVVDDAGYFIDGFGVIDGDDIQIDGQVVTARITDINYSTNTITVDHSVTWTQNIGISLAFSGTDPDVGAFEYDASPPPDAPGWLAGYTYRKKITVDHTYVDSDLSSFPLYVKIAADTDIGGTCQADGDDIRFTDDDGSTLLKFENEDNNFIIASGEATADFWVKVTTVAGAANTDIYIYFGNAGATDGQDLANTWNTVYSAVYHMPDATTSTILESISGGSLNKKGANEPIETATAKVHKGQDFDGTDDYIGLASAAAIDDVFAAGGTMEAFLYADTWGEGGYGEVFAKGANNELYLEESPTLISFLKSFATNRGVWQATYAVAAWKHFAVTYSSASVDNNPIMYIDGASVEATEADTPVGAANSDAANNMTLGNYNTDGEYTWDGKIDELRFAKSILTAAWIKFVFRNITEADNEISFGAKEAIFKPNSLFFSIGEQNGRQYHDERQR